VQETVPTALRQLHRSFKRLRGNGKTERKIEKREGERSGCNRRWIWVETLWRFDQLIEDVVEVS
jgi:hypothetical protein